MDFLVITFFWLFVMCFGLYYHQRKIKTQRMIDEINEQIEFLNKLYPKDQPSILTEIDINSPIKIMGDGSLWIGNNPIIVTLSTPPTQ